LRGVILEKLKKLRKVSESVHVESSEKARTYSLLLQVVGKIGHHDLGLRRNAVLWWATLPALALSTWLGSLAGVDVHGARSTLLTRESLVGGLGEREHLAWDVGGSAVRWSRLALSTLSVALLARLKSGVRHCEYENLCAV